VALRLIAQEGLDADFARHRRIAAATQAAVQRWSTAGTLGFFSQLESARSVSITAITVTPGVDVEGIRTVARERFQVAFAGGLGPLAGRIFRIGHLGDINEAMILGSLAGIEAAMTAQGVPYGPNGVAAAVASLAGADRP
jgi:alanine-glyoxylate transaminase/serine-glyoxylate transaminase/serine-pyruvate transaminase